MAQRICSKGQQTKGKQDRVWEASFHPIRTHDARPEPEKPNAHIATEAAAPCKLEINASDTYWLCTTTHLNAWKVYGREKKSYINCVSQPKIRIQTTDGGFVERSLINRKNGRISWTGYSFGRTAACVWTVWRVRTKHRWCFPFFTAIIRWSGGKWLLGDCLHFHILC